jgi:deazaflavin-dependent oxidoreductase (nitroreductase family)
MSTSTTDAPKLPPAWFKHAFWRGHRLLHRLSGERFLWTPASKRGWGALRLTTTGRRSGQPRTVIIGYIEDGPNLVTMAMNGWDEGHPAWWLNLEANPNATVRLAHEQPRPVRARAASGDERDRLWKQWSEIDTGLDAYASSRRAITPVVVLEPREEAPSDGTRPPPPEPKFRSLGWRAGNAFVSVLARVGVGPIHLLTTRGSKSGRPHTIPVVPVDYDGKRWLVAPYGTVTWVHNVRATGQVRLRYGRATREYTTREVSAEEAGPVLKRYLAIATKTRARFNATQDSPVEDFIAEADRHPVFELIAEGSGAP